MKCELCSAELDAATLRCPGCGAKYTPVCVRCGAAMKVGEETCPRCGGEGLPGLDMTREELTEAGIKCFMPYAGDRVYDIYFGGNHDGGGWEFHNFRGYVREPPQPRVVLPALVEGRPIYGIWNEFFCVGDEFVPGKQEAAFARMMQIREIVVSNGVREAFTYAFFNCAGLETLELPRSMVSMKYDFYDLFMDGQEVMGNGVKKTPVTIRYRGTEEDWKKVAVTSRFWDYVDMGCLRMVYLGR